MKFFIIPADLYVHPSRRVQRWWILCSWIDALRNLGKSFWMLINNMVLKLFEENFVGWNERRMNGTEMSSNVIKMWAKSCEKNSSLKTISPDKLTIFKAACNGKAVKLDGTGKSIKVFDVSFTSVGVGGDWKVHSVTSFVTQQSLED